MKFHQNISTCCRVIQVLVFWEYVYKVKQAILHLKRANGRFILQGTVIVEKNPRTFFFISYHSKGVFEYEVSSRNI